jgi:DNA replication and repair protein RecF
MDGVISQSNPEYLRNLIRYNKVLAQRNSLLKFFALNNTFDAETLSVYDEQLQLLGTSIFMERQRFLEAFVPLFRKQYQAISGGNELVNLRYQSTLLDGELLDQLQSGINKDRALQYTSVGIHKDDLRFEISDHPIKKFGSQGQQKSYLISLKFAQFQLIKQQEKTTPILLLDDIFDKLDENRVAHIITLVEDENFGQIFLSDTHPERTENVVRAIHQSYKIFKL